MPSQKSDSRIELLEDLVGEILDADTAGEVSLPQELRERLVDAYNDSERVPKESPVDA